MANREKGTADADKYSELIQVLVKPATKKEWEIIKEYDDTFLWDSVLYQAWFFDTKTEAKQFVQQHKLQEVQ